MSGKRSTGRSFVRTNHRIRVPQVRCILPNGDMAGVIPTREALGLAQQHNLDLVEVSPNADPPVCRIMDFGKFRYDESVRRKKAKQVQHRTQVKEVKFHANVEEHDYQTKMGRIHKFLSKGDKVKVSLQFRGRENAHRELGFDLVKRVVKECEEVASVEMHPKLVGRAVVCMLGAKSAKPN